MDRELVLAVLAILLGGGALTAAGWWPRAATGAARDITLVSAAHGAVYGCH